VSRYPRPLQEKVLPSVFRNYYSRRGMRSLIDKADYHEVARFVPIGQVASEVVEVLDAIHKVAERPSACSPGNR